jgi:hypothetical protein
MTNHTGRLYAAAVSLAVFFVLWAAIAAHPWQATASDPRLAALAQREQFLRRDAALVRQVVSQRRVAAAAVAKANRLAAVAQANRAAAVAQVTHVAAVAQTNRVAAVASAPVRVVTLPPLVITRTS